MIIKRSIALLSLVVATEASCFDKETYYSIDRDIETIALRITDEDELVHFYGGIVRLAAHDFMDYDRHSNIPMGTDGCIEWHHEVNKGLWGSIWCDDGSCELTNMYNEKYSQLSKADFWIVSGNAVIRQLSVNQGLDLIDTFLWGRKDADSCENQGDRIPIASGCREVEDALLDAMDLTWRDAVALMGAHTIGKGHTDFSGHEGYWMPTAAESLIFDKKYYEEIVRRTWRPRNLGTLEEDFTASTDDTHEEPQFMLKTDLCFWYDTDINYPCCSRTNRWLGETNRCDWENMYSDNRCWKYENDNSRMEAVESVVEFLGGGFPNENNDPFYQAFARAWYKATTNGQNNLKAIHSKCW